jgi:hypothetical protein
MPSLSFEFNGAAMGSAFVQNVNKGGERVKKAMLLAAKDVAQQILDRGRADIATEGDFGTRWQQGLQASVTQQSNGEILISVTHDIPWFKMFMKGAVIKGKPLLWIPLPDATDARGVPAGKYPGRLIKIVSSKGKPLLITAAKPKEPKYIGVESVKIPQKFHIADIIEAARRRYTDLYRARFRSLNT